MLTDLIKFTVKKDCLNDAIVYMREQTENTRRDEGLISASVFQSDADPAVLYMLLQWENEEAVKAHLKKPYDLEFRKKMDLTLASPVEPVAWQQII